MPKILLYLLPNDDSSNEYFRLLKKALREEDPNIEIAGLPKNQLWRLLIARKSKEKRKVVINIHWSTVLYGSSYWLKSLCLLALNSLAILALRFIYGYKVGWTIHNYYAHDYPHPWVDRLGRKVLLCLSDFIITQQYNTQAVFKKKAPHQNVYYAPHGNYVGAYGPQISSAEDWREERGISKDEIVLLSLGMIRPYKLNDEIIRALNTLPAEKSKKYRLLIIGKGDGIYCDTLKNLSIHKNIIIENRFVENDNLPTVLAAADYSIYFYDKSEITSGSLLLSLSYGLASVCRDINATEIIEEGVIGLVFKDREELTNILASDRLFRGYDRDKVVKSVQDISWKETAQRLLFAYREV